MIHHPTMKHDSDAAADDDDDDDTSSNCINSL